MKIMRLRRALAAALVSLASSRVCAGDDCRIAAARHDVLRREQGPRRDSPRTKALEEPVDPVVAPNAGEDAAGTTAFKPFLDNMTSARKAGRIFPCSRSCEIEGCARAPPRRGSRRPHGLRRQTRRCRRSPSRARKKNCRVQPDHDREESSRTEAGRLKGKKVDHTRILNSGHPSSPGAVPAEGIVPDKIQVLFSGGNGRRKGVEAGEYDAGTVASTCSAHGEPGEIS